MFVHIERLQYYDAAFHLALDHVDLGVSATLQRRFP
jgi:hypothetical protein